MQVRRGIKKAWGVGAVRWLNKSVPAAEWPALVVYHSAVREADKGAGGGSRGRRGCLPQQQVQRSSGHVAGGPAWWGLDGTEHQEERPRVDDRRHEAEPLCINVCKKEKAKGMQKTVLGAQQAGGVAGAPAKHPCR